MRNQQGQPGRARPRLTQLAALMASSTFATLLVQPALAQNAAAPAGAASAPGKAGDAVGLERIVVTATSQLKSKMRSSAAVTDIDQEQIKEFSARTEAEVLLMIPGIRTESTAGPGGNANITVRGLPIASGGSKYVQLQEDGLPTVQFGDMNFANNDYWMRFDNSVDSIQTLRGGSSSVFASHAPGAVINYISKTGRQTGGSIGLSRGINYAETRVDGDYGTSLGSGLRYHVGGYYREGEGTRNATANSLLGYQLKGNITKDLNGGKGHVRLYFKVLDEHAPTTPQTFVNATQNGTSVGGFSRTPNYDGTRDSQYSIYNSSVTGVDPVTRQITNTSLVDGITVNSRAVGFEFRNELANGFTVDNKFRMASNSGSFRAQFWNVQTLGSLLGGYAAGTEARYFNGPGAGTVVSAGNLATGLVSNSAAINTTLHDMGNMFNDLSVSKTFKLDGVGTLDVKGGLFLSRQNVVQTWAISERVMEVGQDGRLIDLYTGAGAAAAALTTAGLTGYNNQWGACCARDIDARFTTDAPYLSLNLATGDLDLEGGIRRETFQANGRYAGPKLLGTGDTNNNGVMDPGETGGLDVNGDGRITGAERSVYIADTSNPSFVNYKISYTNFSFGANYRLTSDLSVFARTSKGVRAISDRLLFSPNINGVTGLLAAGGGADAALAPVKQTEAGVKHRGTFGPASYSVAATIFQSTTSEFDYDQTRQDNPALPNYAGPKLNQLSYKSNGFEIESGGSIGNFGLRVNIVYSNEEITGDAAGSAVDAANAGTPGYVNRSQVGKTSGGVPKLRYNISPRFAFGDAVVGATIRGQSKVYTGNDNVNTIDGHYIVSAFASYDFGGGLSASLNVNNLLDKVYPASGGGFVGGSTSVFGAGVQTGRTANVTVRYSF